MFGLFGKSGFNSEIEKLENEHKMLGAQLMSSMQMVNIQEQMRIIDAMLSLYDKRLECCKKYGKFDMLSKLEEEKARLRSLRG